MEKSGAGFEGAALTRVVPCEATDKICVGGFGGGGRESVGVATAKAAPSRRTP